jgi:transposase
MHDRDGGQELLSDELKKELPRLERLELVWADGAYTSEFRRWAEEERGWHVEVPYHQDRQLSGATNWRRSHAGFRCCRGGGLWREPSRGSARRVG